MVPAVLASAMAAVVTMAAETAEAPETAAATKAAETATTAEAEITFTSGAKASLSLCPKLFRTAGGNPRFPLCGRPSPAEPAIHKNSLWADNVPAVSSEAVMSPERRKPGLQSTQSSIYVETL